jgi:hypothetical protein
LLATAPFRHNVRYCRDRDACREGAARVDSRTGLVFLSAAVVEAFPERAVQINLIRMVPAHLHEGIAEYVRGGRPTGGFLRSVFENDLTAAAMRADEINRPALAAIALFVVWHCPAECWGHPEKVVRWITQHRLRREAAAGTADDGR